MPGAPIYRAFNEALYKRGTGAQGGQFVAKDGTKSSAIGYDGKRGSGYGTKGGDGNVKALQKELNRLGITDAQGKPLAVDGKFGPKTTAAVRRLQAKLKLPVDGKITPALLKRIKGIKKTTTLTEAKPAAKKAAPAGKPAPPMQKITPRKAAPVKRSVSYSSGMTDLERHGTHNQKSHGNRLGKPSNVGGKTGLARGAEAARVGTNDVRLDDEVEIVRPEGGGGSTRGGPHVGKKGRIVDLEGVRPIVELDDGRQVEIPKIQLKVARTRDDPSLDKELRAKMDREVKEARARSDALRKARRT